jgi:hypothetical protein
MTRLPGWNWLRIVILDLRRSPSPSATFARSRFHDRRLCRIMPNIRHNPAQTAITWRLEVVRSKRDPGLSPTALRRTQPSDPDAITDRNQPQSTTRGPTALASHSRTRTSTWHCRYPAPEYATDSPAPSPPRQHRNRRRHVRGEDRSDHRGDASRALPLRPSPAGVHPQEERENAPARPADVVRQAGRRDGAPPTGGILRTAVL